MNCLDKLNSEQRKAAISEKNTILTACPGSGKTRTLTYRLAYFSNKYEHSRKLNIAITYTNRAADEILKRVLELGIDASNIWVGTIHQFCLEFVIRPYSMYSVRLKKGYAIIDEFIEAKYFMEMCEELGIKYKPWDNYKKNLKYYKMYLSKIQANKEIDFDDILGETYKLLKENSFIGQNISRVIRTINVDEYQDTNEVSYNILGLIGKSNKEIINYFVGDVNQAIYGGLGGCAKEVGEIEKIFESEFEILELTGCYRSTQQVVDYYKEYQAHSMEIHSKADIKDEKGTIAYLNDVTTKTLSDRVIEVISYELDNGIPDHEICVLAPQWSQIYGMAKNIRAKLPNLKIDAPSVSPIKYDSMNIFCLISKLLFTMPGENVLYRKRIVQNIYGILENDYGITIPKFVDVFHVLYCVNSVDSAEDSGIGLIKQTISNLMKLIDVNMSDYPKLNKVYDEFFEKIKDRIARYSLDDTIEGYKKCYQEKKGVVLSSYHGVKGEEYEVVIAYGMLKGYVPNWNVIYDKNQNEDIEANKLIYVVTSRAKRDIFIIAEKGHIIKSSGNTMVLSEQFIANKYKYSHFGLV